MLHEMDFEEKVNLTFSMYDQNNTGVVTRKDVENLLEHFNDYNSLNFDFETMNEIVNVLMQELDPDHKEEITKSHFERFLQDHKFKPLTFNPFTRERTYSLVVSCNKDSTKSISEPLIEKKISTISCLTRCRIHLKSSIWLTVYILCNLLVSFGSFYIWWSIEFLPVPFARFFAGLIILNSSFLLFFMCENFMTYLNSTCFAKFLPLEDTKFYHSICGMVFTLAGIGHSIVHLSWTLPYIASFRSLSELNKIMKKKLDAIPSYFYLVFESVPGSTGLLLLIFTILMTITAFPCIRRKSFNLFYFIHKLYYPVFILIGIHGMLQLVVAQTYWMFISLPAFIYTCEIILKIYRHFAYKTRIRSIKFLDSGVVQLIIDKPPGFTFIPGHYAKIQIPEISRWQWHPFTIASSPVQQNLTFYISAVGSWTKQVENIGKISNPVEKKYDCNFEKKRKNLEQNTGTNTSTPANRKEIEEIMKWPFCRIEGPFGAPAQNFKDYENIILIASGIGATPFSSILFDTMYRMSLGCKDCKIKKLDFYWVIRSYVSISWLIDLFKELLTYNKSNLVNIHLFFTCSQQKYDFRSFFLWHGLELLKAKRRDLVSDYCGNIYWGRPEWDQVICGLKEKYPNNTKIGVFVCGNNELSQDVYTACKKNSSPKITFEFQKENF